MGKDKVAVFRGKEEVVGALSEFLREKAVLMLQAAVEAEAEEFVSRHADRRDEVGRRQVVRNGYLPQREIVTGIGALSVSMPRVRDQSEEALAFRSSLVPAYVRRAKSVRCARGQARCGYRNGYGKLRHLSLTAGTIEVRPPRLRNLSERFESRVLPLFKRRRVEVGAAAAVVPTRACERGFRAFSCAASGSNCRRAIRRSAPMRRSGRTATPD